MFNFHLSLIGHYSIGNGIGELCQLRFICPCLYFIQLQNILWCPEIAFNMLYLVLGELGENGIGRKQNWAFYQICLFVGNLIYNSQNKKSSAFTFQTPDNSVLFASQIKIDTNDKRFVTLRICS